MPEGARCWTVHAPGPPPDPQISPVGTLAMWRPATPDGEGRESKRREDNWRSKKFYKLLGREEDDETRYARLGKVLSTTYRGEIAM